MKSCRKNPFPPKSRETDHGQWLRMTEDTYRGRISRNIRLQRMRLLRTQGEIAREIGMQRAHWSRMESGRECPDLVTLLRICRALKTTPQRLVR